MNSTVYTCNTNNLRLYFDPDAESRLPRRCSVLNFRQDFLNEVKRHTRFNENIVEVTLYKSRENCVGNSVQNATKTFAIIASDGPWKFWSLEINSEDGITIQRSTNEKTLALTYRGKRRQDEISGIEVILLGSNWLQPFYLGNMFTVLDWRKTVCNESSLQLSNDYLNLAEYMENWIDKQTSPISETHSKTHSHIKSYLIEKTTIALLDETNRQEKITEACHQYYCELVRLKNEQKELIGNLQKILFAVGICCFGLFCFAVRFGICCAFQ